jgi:hypothetical protein
VLSVRAALVLAIGAIAATVVGCASLPPDGDAASVTANLPPGVPGATDRRADFAALFARELQRDAAAPSAADVTAWLYGVPTVAPLDADAAGRIARAAARRAGTAVLVVPGLFGDCFLAQSAPFSDGVQRTVERTPTEGYGQYADLGLGTLRMVALPGRGSAVRNGHILADAIRAEAARPGVDRLVLVAYSKGTTDTLRALAELGRDGALPAQPMALVAVAGVVMGTPLADRAESIYAALSPIVNPLDCTESQGDELAGLTRRDNRDWLLQHPLPPSLRTYSVVAYADIADTGPALRLGHRLLDWSEPRNDGMVPAGDAILPGSELLATARADHWDIAMPRDRHPSAAVRAMGSGRHYPREALFRALLTWVVGAPP